MFKTVELLPLLLLSFDYRPESRLQVRTDSAIEKEKEDKRGGDIESTRKKRTREEGEVTGSKVQRA